jgi:hypothetical protein
MPLAADVLAHIDVLADVRSRLAAVNREMTPEFMAAILSSPVLASVLSFRQLAAPVTQATNELYDYMTRCASKATEDVNGLLRACLSPVPMMASPLLTSPLLDSLLAHPVESTHGIAPADAAHRYAAISEFVSDSKWQFVFPPLSSLLSSALASPLLAAPPPEGSPVSGRMSLSMQQHAGMSPMGLTQSASPPLPSPVLSSQASPLLQAAPPPRQSSTQQQQQATHMVMRQAIGFGSSVFASQSGNSSALSSPLSSAPRSPVGQMHPQVFVQQQAQQQQALAMFAHDASREVIHSRSNIVRSSNESLSSARPSPSLSREGIPTHGGLPSGSYTREPRDVTAGGLPPLQSGYMSSSPESPLLSAPLLAPPLPPGGSRYAYSTEFTGPPKLARNFSDSAEVLAPTVRKLWTSAFSVSSPLLSWPLFVSALKVIVANITAALLSDLKLFGGLLDPPEGSDGYFSTQSGGWSDGLTPAVEEQNVTISRLARFLQCFASPPSAPAPTGAIEYNAQHLADAIAHFAAGGAPGVFAGHLNRSDTEAALIPAGPGSFVVRFSSTVPCDLAISYIPMEPGAQPQGLLRTNSVSGHASIVHELVTLSQSATSFVFRSRTYANLAHLVADQSAVLRRPATVAVSTAVSKSKRCMSFHGLLTYEATVTRLTHQPPGSYLLRMSQSQRHHIVIAYVSAVGTVAQTIVGPVSNPGYAPGAVSCSGTNFESLHAALTAYASSLLKFPVEPKDPSIGLTTAGQGLCFRSSAELLAAERLSGPASGYTASPCGPTGSVPGGRSSVPLGSEPDGELYAQVGPDLSREQLPVSARLQQQAPGSARSSSGASWGPRPMMQQQGTVPEPSPTQVYRLTASSDAFRQATPTGMYAVPPLSVPSPSVPGGAVPSPVVLSHGSVQQQQQMYGNVSTYHASSSSHSNSARRPSDSSSTTSPPSLSPATNRVAPVIPMVWPEPGRPLARTASDPHVSVVDLSEAGELYASATPQLVITQQQPVQSYGDVYQHQHQQQLHQGGVGQHVQVRLERERDPYAFPYPIQMAPPAYIVQPPLVAARSEEGDDPSSTLYQSSAVPVIERERVNASSPSLRSEDPRVASASLIPMLTHPA